MVPLWRALHVAAAGAAAVGVLCSLPAIAQTANRPHDIATRDGHIVQTSLGTDYVTVLLHGETTPDLVDVGAPSWGVCIADGHAYVTLPSEQEIAVIDLSGPSTATSISVKRGCTEIVSNADGDTLYVANHGISPATLEGDKWQNSILRIDLASPSSYDEFLTERQPRALALSPDETRLIVGTVQGALGGAGMVPNHVDLANGFYKSHDGGSLLIHDAASGAVLERIAVGSPVRGVAVLRGAVYGAADLDEYRIYFTSVGFGVQSEDPGEGGRAIPNVVSSVRMSAAHAPLERQDTIFRHDPKLEFDDSDTNSELPAVLPEKVVVRPASSVAGNYEAELWITNSASGTVSRAAVDSLTGTIATSGTESITFPRVTSVANGTFGYTFSDTFAIYEKVSPLDHVRTDSEGTEPFRSRPRGIAYDAQGDSIVVCTESFGDMIAFDATTSSLPSSAPTPLVAGTKVPLWKSDELGEGNFFTFGGGFDFREDSEATKVNNLSCGSCHVDGHTDGKARLTIRFPQNQPGNPEENRFVTAVPSVRDIEHTEWIFFEGLRTIQDRGNAQDCVYCSVARFFPDTRSFTPETAPSPLVDPGAPLTSEAVEGRAWFDDMNCSRCHGGRSKQFDRTREDSVGFGAGPLAFGQGILSDPTQSFISFQVATLPLPDDDNSMRNMTNVGTRIDDDEATINPIGETLIPGINTPSLAGAWDNRPYFHDGRYRTLDEVLAHTWLNVGQGNRAARLWGAPGVPDNLLDDESHPLLNSAEPPVLDVHPTTGLVTNDGDTLAVMEFRSHAHADPDGAGTDWVSVKDYLTGEGVYEELLEFLRSLSSDLDPYPAGDPAISSLAVANPTGPTATVSWSTAQSTVSRVFVYNDEDSTEYSDILGPGSTSFIVPVPQDNRTWTARVSSAYNGKVATDSISWRAYDATFVNRSDDTEIGDSFTDQPYAAATLDYDSDSDGRMDLLISNDSGDGVLLQNSLHQDPGLRDVPQFVDDNSFGFSLGEVPSETRALALGDIDADGDLDVFLAAQDSLDVRFYESTGSASPWFQDIADDTGTGSTPTIRELAGDSWTAAFADVDRDGRVDLFLGRASTSAGVPSGGLADYLLRNKTDLSSGDVKFADISSTAQINAAGNLATASASFGDLGGDKEPELFVGDHGSTGSVLYRLSSFNANGIPVYDYQDGGSNPHLPSISPDDYQDVTAAAWADMDSDKDLDLVLTKSLGSGDNTIILWGDGAGGFTGTPKKIESGFSIATLLATDLDLSGSTDILLAPAVDDSLVLLLSNLAPSQHASSFDDVTGQAGLGDGSSKVTTLVAADFSGPSGDPDGDFDLYVGRAAAAPDTAETNTSSVYYRSGAGTGSSDDAPQNRWLGVRPVWGAGGSVKWSTAGTVITIDLPAGASSPALKMSQILGADGIRSAQPVGEARFGLGTAEGPATVTIQWPDGKVKTTQIADAAFDSTHVINAGHNPAIVEETPPNALNPKATYEILTQGTAKLIFTWYTNYAADPDLEQVTIALTSGSGCPSGTTYTAGDTGVTSTIRPTSDGLYKHVLTYTSVTCGTSCVYTVTVKSAVDSRQSTGTATLSMSTCGGFQQ